MADCQKLESIFTPYVDRELEPGEAARVDAHLAHCPPCASRVAAERSVRRLLQERRACLCRDAASDTLRARCTGARPAEGGGAAADVGPGSPVRARWAQRLAPLALAASLVLLVGGAFIYEGTGHSVRMLAAELTADHLKCFMIGPTGVGEAGAEQVLTSQFDWHPQLPDGDTAAGLELVGARLCIYGQGRVAHLMYRHNGHPVSVFMLPDTSRAGELVSVLGHQAAVWTAGNRTFVLIAREPKREVEQMASVVHAGLR